MKYVFYELYRYFVAKKCQMFDIVIYYSFKVKSNILSLMIFLLAFACNNSDFRVNRFSGRYLIFPCPGGTFLQRTVISVAWLRREFMSGWVYHSRWMFKRRL